MNPAAFRPVSRRNVLAHWRRRRLLCGLLAVASLLLTTFVGPLLPIPTLVENSECYDHVGAFLFCGSRQIGIFHTTCNYSMSMNLQTQLPHSVDPAALRRSSQSLAHSTKLIFGCDPQDSPGQNLDWTDEEWGLPFRCVHGWRGGRDDYEGSWTIFYSPSLVDLPPVLYPRAGVRRQVPLMPIPLAIIANLTFYAALWSVLLVAAPVYRESRRVRAGRCPACRYDLQHHHAGGCPECGWGKPVAATPPSA